MAKILPLIYSPDPLLAEISQPVKEVNDEIRKFMDDMVKTMYSSRGIGLAAVQVGELKRILVMDIDYEEDRGRKHDNCCGFTVKNENPLYLVNPEIIEFSDEKSSYNEGCLSFPGASADVIRPKKVTVKYLDYNGNEQIQEMDGILATCIQHEMDHLNGITFVDHLSRMKKEIILKKVLKMRKSMS